MPQNKNSKLIDEVIMTQGIDPLRPSYIPTTLNGYSGTTTVSMSDLHDINYPYAYTYQNDKIPAAATDNDIRRDTDSEGLFARVERIENMLGISMRDRSLENKYPDLKAAGDEYEQHVRDALYAIHHAIKPLTIRYESIKDECSIMEKMKPSNSEYQIKKEFNDR